MTISAKVRYLKDQVLLILPRGNPFTAKFFSPGRDDDPAPERHPAPLFPSPPRKYLLCFSQGDACCPGSAR